MPSAEGWKEPFGDTLVFIFTEFVVAKLGSSYVVFLAPRFFPHPTITDIQAYPGLHRSQNILTILTTVKPVALCQGKKI